MADILAPEISLPVLSTLSQNERFTLSTLRGQWVLLLFVKIGKESRISDFLSQLQEWTANHNQRWASYNCQVVVVCGQRDIPKCILENPSIVAVCDEDKIATTSFHCTEEGNSYDDFASVLVDAEGYIRYVIKNDMIASEKIASNLRVLQALARNESDAEEKSTEDVDDVSPAKSFLDRAFEKWTNSGISEIEQRRNNLVSEASNLLSYYQWQLKERPLVTKAITSAIISAAGEALGSWLKGSKQSFVQILRRIGVFFVYGLCIAGPFFHWWYAVLDKYTRSMGLPRILTFIIQLAVNQLVMTPAMLVVTLAFLQLTRTTSFGSIIRNVKGAFVGALYTNWRVWTVAQAINFQVVPLDYRVLFGNVVALWWNIVLSWTTSAPSEN